MYNCLFVSSTEVQFCVTCFYRPPIDRLSHVFVHYRPLSSISIVPYRPFLSSTFLSSTFLSSAIVHRPRLSIGFVGGGDEINPCKIQKKNRRTSQASKTHLSSREGVHFQVKIFLKFLLHSGYRMKGDIFDREHNI